MSRASELPNGLTTEVGLRAEEGHDPWWKALLLKKEGWKALFERGGWNALLGSGASGLTRCRGRSDRAGPIEPAAS